MQLRFWMLTLIVALMTIAIAPGARGADKIDDKRTILIGGAIRLKKNAPIFLRLLDLDAEKKERIVREQVIELTPEDVSRGTVRYEFAGLRPGRYALKCFQDTNGNKKIDIGLFGPKEPWATYRHARPKLRGPRFEEMAFEASQDVTSADLLLR